jgi:hypothetical protein
MTTRPALIHETRTTFEPRDLPPQPDAATHALFALPTREIRLARSFVDGLHAIAPRPRRSKARSVLAVAAIVGLAFISPIRARAVAILGAGWTRVTAHVETPAAAHELATKLARAATQAVASAPATTAPSTSANTRVAFVVRAVAFTPDVLVISPSNRPKKTRVPDHARASAAGVVR